MEKRNITYKRENIALESRMNPSKIVEKGLDRGNMLKDHDCEFFRLDNKPFYRFGPKQDNYIEIHTKISQIIFWKWKSEQNQSPSANETQISFKEWQVDEQLSSKMQQWMWRKKWKDISKNQRESIVHLFSTYENICKSGKSEANIMAF